MRRIVVRVRAICILAMTVALAQQTATAQSAQEATKKKLTGYAHVNGLKMYYEVVGEGLPAVFIHPVASQSGLVPGLTANRRWVSMDLQGHGRTADIDRPMSCEQHVNDIAALLEHLKITQADFFGDSFGGAIAVTMAIRHPNLVRRVICYGNSLEPFPPNLAEAIPPDSDLVRWEREEYQKVAPNPEHWPRFFAKVLSSGSTWQGLSADELRAIRSPVLVVCGDHDLIPVERCAEIARQIPNGQLAVIPDASHFVLFSEPEKLLPTVAAFLDGRSPELPLSTFKSGYYPGVSR